jgi:hypothetical protein
LNADGARSPGPKRVPRGSPATIGPRTSLPAPAAMTVGIPAAAAISAASTLLCMPPLPSGEPSPNAAAATAEPSAITSAPGVPGARE